MGKPRLFVISGPSGAGKGTLVSAVREERPDLGLTVSATTRPPRPHDIPDVSYHFLSEEEFDRRIERGDFLEWADVHGHKYGTLEVLEQRLRGRGTEDESSIELRLANARHEMDLAKDYDARVVNDDLATAVRDLANVLESYEMDGGNS